MGKATAVRAVLSDACGTPFEVCSVALLAEQMFSRHGERLAAPRRDEQITFPEDRDLLVALRARRARRRAAKGGLQGLAAAVRSAAFAELLDPLLSVPSVGRLETQPPAPSARRRSDRLHGPVGNSHRCAAGTAAHFADPRKPSLSVAAGQRLGLELEASITEHGTRMNVNVGLRYLRTGLAGIGREPIRSMMEDAAAAELFERRSTREQFAGILTLPLHDEI